MVTGQGEGRELPGCVVQPKKQIIQGVVRSGGKQTGFISVQSCLEALCRQQHASLRLRAAQP